MTPEKSAEAPRTPAWVEDETQCPCGNRAGPDFRYGLCDACAKETPASALLRMGVLLGSVVKARAALAARDAQWRTAVNVAHVRFHRDEPCDWCASLRALLSTTQEPG